MDHFEQFERRLLQDALTSATQSYWIRRAQAFEDAKPRSDDYPGRATQDDLRDQWRRLDGMAKACRARAECVPFDDVTSEVEGVLGEAA